MQLLQNPKKATFSFLSLKKFAWAIGVPLEKLRHLAETANQQYAPFQKKTGDKIRTIDNPREFLKFVQRRINTRILAHFPFPPYVIGGVKGRDPLWHPSIHIKAPVVVTIDIKNCFPSISNKKIYEIWLTKLGCSPPVASLATKLTSYEGHLPLGAPTSNTLANIALLPAVKNVFEIAKKHNLKMSQYIDDQALSGKCLSDELISLVIKEFSKHQFTINPKKVLVMRNSGSQQVTKKNVNRAVSIPKRKRKTLEVRLHVLSQTNVQHPAYEKLYNSVKGSVHSIAKLHPSQSTKMLQEIRNLPIPLKDYAYAK